MTTNGMGNARRYAGPAYDPRYPQHGRRQATRRSEVMHMENEKAREVNEVEDTAPKTTEDGATKAGERETTTGDDGKQPA